MCNQVRSLEISNLIPRLNELWMLVHWGHLQPCNYLGHKMSLEIEKHAGFVKLSLHLYPSGRQYRFLSILLGRINRFGLLFGDKIRSTSRKRNVQKNSSSSLSFFFIRFCFHLVKYWHAVEADEKNNNSAMGVHHAKLLFFQVCLLQTFVILSDATDVLPSPPPTLPSPNDTDLVLFVP